VEMMWHMLQQDMPDDYVIGTGVAPTMREFIEEAFSYVDLDWKEYVDIDPLYYRPAEVDYLQADAAKARKILDWNPKITYKDLARIMIDADMQAVGLEPIGEGLEILKKNFSGWHRWEKSVTALLNSYSNGVE
jgi:GDPmannose 4,6-dehydratase